MLQFISATAFGLLAVIMSELVPPLEDLDINRKRQDFVDITDKFFELTNEIQYSHIVKSKEFPLLHGTHALEILNPRLDTFLLEEVIYDISDSANELTLEETTAIIGNLLKSLTSWMGQNVSIPNSILSCEYISQILEIYTKDISLERVLTKFKSGSLNEIIIKFSILLISTVRFILALAMKSQIYEEEDLNTSTMNLNWLYELSPNEIIKHSLVSPKTWKSIQENVEENDDIKTKHISLLKNAFTILQSINSLESIYQWDINLFHLKSSHDLTSKLGNKLTQLENVVEKLNEFESIDIDGIHVPRNCFNANSQIKFDNQAPPKVLPVVSSSWSDCTLNLIQLFNDCSDVLKTVQASNSLEFMEWLKYLENKRNNNDANEINGLHIFSRVLFFSFINSNNQQQEQDFVFRDKNLRFKDLFYSYMKELLLDGSKIDLEFQKRIKNVDAMQQIEYYLETVSLLFKESLFLPTLNPSRQRQFKCKELRYWNMRQVETGQLEDYFRQIHFYTPSERYYPLTSVIIFFKLKCILEVILKSIELNLFKDIREYVSVYYQVIVLVYHLNHHLDNMLGIANKSKKSKLSLYLLYLKNEYNMIYQLSILKAKGYELMTYLGFYYLPKNLIHQLSNREDLLYNLQWRQFNNITDPEMLSYQDFKSRLQVNEKVYQNDFANYIESLNGEAKLLVGEFNKSFKFLNILLDKLDWFHELKSIKRLDFENLHGEIHKTKTDIENLIRFAKSSESIAGHTIKICKLGRHCYFPGFEIIEKTNN